MGPQNLASSKPRCVLPALANTFQLVKHQEAKKKPSGEKTTWILKHTTQSSSALTPLQIRHPPTPTRTHQSHHGSRMHVMTHRRSHYNTRMWGSVNSLILHRLLTDSVPNLTFFIASSQERRLSILLPPQKCSWLPGRKQKAYSSLNKTKPFLIHRVFQNGIHSFNKYLLSSICQAPCNML